MQRPSRLSNSLWTTAARLSMVLFEEADILFPSDRGFVKAVCTLLKTARCPIVLTCNGAKGGWFVIDRISVLTAAVVHRGRG